MAQLSGRLKAMKFMKRKEEAVIREKLRTERKKRVDAEKWTLESSAGGSITDRVRVCGDDDEDDPYRTRYVLGRRSFGGFNPTVVNMNREAMAGARGSAAKSISDAEMARRYSQFVGMRGKQVESFEVSPQRAQRAGKKRKGGDPGRLGANRRYPRSGRGSFAGVKRRDSGGQDTRRNTKKMKKFMKPSQRL